MKPAFSTPEIERIKPEATTTPQKGEPYKMDARTCGQILDAEFDESNFLLGNGFMERGFGSILVGTTGIGKSTGAMQMAMKWKLGLPEFGIEARQPLKSVFIQSENSGWKLQRMMKSVHASIPLTPDQDADVREGVVVVTCRDRRGVPFITDVLRPALEKYKPDILWLDHALAFYRGQATDSEAVGQFLREQLDPEIMAAKCGLMLLCHTPKPNTGKDAKALRGSDLAYSIFGSVEWPGWARGILAFLPTGTHDIYHLHAAKGGGETGWRDEEGRTVFERTLAYSRTPGEHIFREADEDDFARIEVKDDKPQEGGMENVTRGARLITALSVEDGRSLSELNRLPTLADYAKTTLDRHLRQLAKAGLAKMDDDTKRWFRV